MEMDNKGGVILTHMKVEQLRDNIIALRPVYTDEGNSTEIYLHKGTQFVDRRGIKSVITALARSYAIDLSAQRKNMQDKLTRKGLMPFYLDNKRVFVPMKMRKAVSKNDMVYGYVDVSCIGDVKLQGNRDCRLWLNDGRKMEILSSKAAAVQSQYLGQNLLEFLQTEKTPDPAENAVVVAATQMVNTFQQIIEKLDRIENKIR